MKQLIIKVIIPLTIISFTTFTKWWYVLPIDGTDQLFYVFRFLIQDLVRIHWNL